MPCTRDPNNSDERYPPCLKRMLIAGTATIAEGTTRHYIGPNSRRAAVRGVLLERSSQLEIPEKVRRNAALMGETGHTWLANLQQQIVELERRWAINVEQPARRGNEALVAEARTIGGWTSL